MPPWSGNPRRAAGAAVAALVVVAAIAAGAVTWSRRGDGGEPEDVVVVGDSLAEQSSAALGAAGRDAGLHVDVSAYGGSAICDWQSRFDELAADPPSQLVLSFSGNAVTPCFNPGMATLSAQEIADRYRTELEAVLDQFRAGPTDVWAVLPPPIGDPELEPNAEAMRAMYEDVAAADTSLHLIDGGALLAPDGKFHASLPCESWDTVCPPDGLVVVRQPDRIHLTPAGGERYARAIIEAVGD